MESADMSLGAEPHPHRAARGGRRSYYLVVREISVPRFMARPPSVLLRMGLAICRLLIEQREVSLVGYMEALWW
jgi:hypothetical protein